MLPVVVIAGRPNVGKSTLFNAICDSARAQAGNFPFCTIEPNVGLVAVPDERLEVSAASCRLPRLRQSTVAPTCCIGIMRMHQA